MPTRRAAARSRRQRAGFENPSRGSERSRSATKSSRIIASAFLYLAAATLLPRRPVSRKPPVVVRRLLAVEEDEDDRGTKLFRLDATGELDDERGAAGAVVRTDEAGQVLRVVMRSDDDRPRRVAAGHEADDVAQPAGHGLEPSVGQLGLQLRCELPRGRRSGGPRPEAHLAHEPRPGRLLVHAIDGGRWGRSDECERGQRRHEPCTPIT